MPEYSDFIDGLTVDAALEDTDRVVLDGNKTATIATLAADSAFTDQFAPKANPTFTGSVVVPAGNAANEAAQITAYDAATNRVAIAGFEIGNTGERVVAKADVGNPANLTFANIRLSRIGYIVTIATLATTTGGSYVSGATADNSITLPAGFHPEIGSKITRQPTARNGSTGSTVNISVNENGVLFYQDNLAAGQVCGEFSLRWYTADAWPSSLPGTAA